ncbi:MAG TPA: UbiA family prenyltransferase [Alphaproteobacteria bacterium]|nr:UbiA family prenyltransferase [Alphaproteobacteria bacterium]
MSTATFRQAGRQRRTTLPARDPVPLVVDLDGTLILGDLLLESIIVLLKRSLHYALFLPLWILGGRAALKARLARSMEPDLSTVLVNHPFVEHLKKEKARGRRLFLATGTHESWARKIADSFGLFDGVLASSGDANRTGRAKLSLLRERFGATGFDYAGNAAVDYPIWQAARRATVVNAPPRVARWVARHARVEHVFPRQGAGPRTYLRAFRVHQWLKNLLLFAPLIAALHFTDLAAIGAICIGFVSFSLAASSVYILNDIVDIHDDRRHPRKCKRPFASGELPLPQGLVLIPLLLTAAAALAFFLPWKFGAVLAAYYAMTLAYSFKLKQIESVDVLVLAMLYTTRVFAGGMAAGIPLSFWLLSFAIFIFLSLALAKRYAELAMLRERGEKAASGRGYRVADLPLLHSMGTGSGYVAAFVLGLYLNTGQIEFAYSNPRVLWALVPLVIYWITRIWLKTYRGEMHDDPVVFAARDPTSLVIGALFALTILFAML